jgi:putative serine protease PepD
MGSTIGPAGVLESAHKVRMEVLNVNEQPRRHWRRLSAPLGLLAAVGLVAAACGSAVTGSAGALAGSLGGGTTGGNAASSPAINAASPGVTVAPGSGSSASINADTLQAEMVAVIKQITPSVVQIETSSGLGSGVVYDSSGDIITNAHVVGTSTTFKVTMSNGKVYDGTLVGSYTPDDIAVIKVNAAGLTPATFGDSSKLEVGDFVLAVGNPLGFQSSVTEGIVSALNRTVPEPNGSTLPNVIQTSAAINPGNSGGALVDLNGQVVGIPTLAAADPQLGGSAPGIGFAIASNRAVTVANQLIASGKVTASGRAYLGVSIQDQPAGAVVVQLVAGGPAAKAGVQVGDVIESIAGQSTPDTTTVGTVMAGLAPGQVVQVVVQHQSGVKATLSVTLGQLPG